MTSGGYYFGSITIPSEITYDGMSYKVTSIGDFAFYYSDITTVNILENVTSIGASAFNSCFLLTTINIPASMTRVGEYAFAQCDNLTKVNINSIEAWCNIDFYDSFANPLRWAQNLYLNENLVTGLQIPATVTEVKKYVFSYCTSITGVNIPKSVTSVGEYAFAGCTNLITVNTHEDSQLKNIGREAFYYCTSLTDINIPESVTSIGSYAFNSCYNLRAINIPKNITSIGSLTFEGCYNLTTITLSEGLTSIGTSAFCGCSNLADINIPENVVSIGSYAFESCSSLRTIILPEKLKFIGSRAFADNRELRDVYCCTENIPSTDCNSFDGSYLGKATLHVPESTIESYKATAPWNSFGNIVPIEEVEAEKCATPTISYADGKIIFACDTEEAIIKSNVAENIAGDYNDMEIAFVSTYTITAYATKENYEDSDVATLTICWIPCTEEHESEEDGIIAIPSKPVLIQSLGGTITLSGLVGDTEVAVYDLAGRELATAIATDGTATLTTGIEVGSTAVVKIGNNSIKIVIR